MYVAGSWGCSHISCTYWQAGRRPASWQLPCGPCYSLRLRILQIRRWVSLKMLNPRDIASSTASAVVRTGQAQREPLIARNGVQEKLIVQATARLGALSQLVRLLESKNEVIAKGASETLLHIVTASEGGPQSHPSLSTPLCSASPPPICLCRPSPRWAQCRIWYGCWRARTR